MNWLVANPDTTGALAAVGNTIVAFLALIVAAVSIFFTVCGLSLQRRHNSLSVVPVPFIALADYENHLRARIRNDGIGPLLVSRIVYRRNGLENEYEDLVSYMPQLPDGLHWSNFSSGYVRSIRPGDELILIELKGEAGDEKFAKCRDECRRRLTELEIEVEYTDVYGNKFESVSRKLDWFGRRLAPSRNA